MQVLRMLPNTYKEPTILCSLVGNLEHNRNHPTLAQEYAWITKSHKIGPVARLQSNAAKLLEDHHGNVTVGA